MDASRGLRHAARRDQQRRKEQEMGVDGRSASLIWQLGLKRERNRAKSKKNRRKSRQKREVRRFFHACFSTLVSINRVVD